MEQFEQLLTCAICLDRYRNPKLLPCQHSFCMEPCMDGLVDYVRRQVKCPECRAEHRIPYQGVQAFPTNVTLQRFLELHIEITGELPDPTSGQTMERCGVCSEKSYCSLCVHCDKKCCPECKDAHMDILRREITRINSQVRRGLHRLQDALALVEKNTLGLQTNCTSVAEEVDEIYRRLSKALKDRTEYLRNEVDRYLGSELRGLIQLKENLELEIANIQSNCDLADAHINENVPWDDSELLDTKELFLRTIEFIRNFEYEAGDYSRRVRFVMAHDPNQLVLHVAGYGELNIKPETGSGGLLGSTGGLAPPGGSPGLMRSKSDHRLASQYRQQEEERLTRNRYVPDYEYETPEYEAPRNKSRYRSRFMRHRDGEDSDGDSRSTVRFTSTPQEQSNLRERVLDTEDAARGPLSGIFRLTDSPRVMKKLQECERAGKRKKEELPQQPQPQVQPKPQVQVRKVPTATAKQVTEDDEISRIKKQNKNLPSSSETVEERSAPITPVVAHVPAREIQEREPEEPPRRTSIARRTSSDTHTPAARSASSDSSTGSESSTGSGVRSTGAPFTAEEMKQKYLSRAPPTSTTTTVSSAPGVTTTTKDTSSSATSPRPFQSRFLGGGNRAAPPPPPTREEPPPPKKKEDEEDEEEETSSSSEETESETEEESEPDAHSTVAAPSTVPSVPQDRQKTESAMARTDIGPLLARSAEARRGSKEDSPSTRYSTPRGSPAQSVTSPTSTSASTTPGGYTSRIGNDENDESSSTDNVEDNEIADNDNDIDNEDTLRISECNKSQTDSNSDTDDCISLNSLENVGSNSNVTSEVESKETLVDVEKSEAFNRINGNGNNTEGNALVGDECDVKRSLSERNDFDDNEMTLRNNVEVSKDINDSVHWNNDQNNKHATSHIVENVNPTNDYDIVDVIKVEAKSSDENDLKSEENLSSNDVSDGDTSKNTVDSVKSDETSSDTDSEDDRESSSVESVRANDNDHSSIMTADDTATDNRESVTKNDEDVENLFDDNGWVVTDDDLPSSKNRKSLRRYVSQENTWPTETMADLLSIDETTSSHVDGDVVVTSKNTEKDIVDKAESLTENDSNDDEKESISTENSKLNNDVPKVNNVKDVTRNTVYKQSSLGNNGWLVSDSSDESERAVSPTGIKSIVRRKVTSTNDNSKDAKVASDNDSSSRIDDEKKTSDSRNIISNNELATLNKADDGDEDDNDDNDDDNDDDDEETSKSESDDDSTVNVRNNTESSSTNRSRAKLIARSNVENGTLVPLTATAQSKESRKSDESDQTPNVDISIPMQMVTTVFCVSVLCYSVLMNLLL